MASELLRRIAPELRQNCARLHRAARSEVAVGRRHRVRRRHAEREAAAGVPRVAEQEGLLRVGADGLQPKVDAVGEVEASARPARLRGENWDGSVPNGDELRRNCAPERIAPKYARARARARTETETRNFSRSVRQTSSQ